MCEATWPMWVGLWNGLIFSLINNPFWCNTNLHLSTKVKFWFDHSATVWFICQQVYQNNSRLQNFNMFIKMFQTSKWHQCSHEQWWTSLPGDQGWVLSCYQTELKSLSVNKDTSYWDDKRKRNSIASFRCLLPQLDSPTILSGSVLLREKRWDMMTILQKQKVGQMSSELLLTNNTRCRLHPPPGSSCQSCCAPPPWTAEASTLGLPLARRSLIGRGRRRWGSSNLSCYHD